MYIEIGTGSTPFSDSQTNLVAPVCLTNNAGTPTTVTVLSSTVYVAATTACSPAQTIREAALFANFGQAGNTNDVMLIRIVFSGVTSTAPSTVFQIGF